MKGMQYTCVTLGFKHILSCYILYIYKLQTSNQYIFSFLAVDLLDTPAAPKIDKYKS
jgi:hypothetical protein